MPGYRRGRRRLGVAPYAAWNRLQLDWDNACPSSYRTLTSLDGNTFRP